MQQPAVGLEPTVSALQREVRAATLVGLVGLVQAKSELAAERKHQGTVAGTPPPADGPEPWRVGVELQLTEASEREAEMARAQERLAAELAQANAANDVLESRMRLVEAQAQAREMDKNESIEQASALRGEMDGMLRALQEQRSRVHRASVSAAVRQLVLLVGRLQQARVARAVHGWRQSLAKHCECGLRRELERVTQAQKESEERLLADNQAQRSAKLQLLVDVRHAEQETKEVGQRGKDLVQHAAMAQVKLVLKRALQGRLAGLVGAWQQGVLDARRWESEARTGRDGAKIDGLVLVRKKLERRVAELEESNAESQKLLAERDATVLELRAEAGERLASEERLEALCGEQASTIERLEKELAELAKKKKANEDKLMEAYNGQRAEKLQLRAEGEEMTHQVEGLQQEARDIAQHAAMAQIKLVLKAALQGELAQQLHCWHQRSVVERQASAHEEQAMKAQASQQQLQAQAEEALALVDAQQQQIGQLKESNTQLKSSESQLSAKHELSQMREEKANAQVRDIAQHAAMAQIKLVLKAALQGELAQQLHCWHQRSVVERQASAQEEQAMKAQASQEELEQAVQAQVALLEENLKAARCQAALAQVRLVLKSQLEGEIAGLVHMWAAGLWDFKRHEAEELSELREAKLLEAYHTQKSEFEAAQTVTEERGKEIEALGEDLSNAQAGEKLMRQRANDARLRLAIVEVVNVWNQQAQAAAAIGFYQWRFSWLTERNVQLLNERSARQKFAQSPVRERVKERAEQRGRRSREEWFREADSESRNVNTTEDAPLSPAQKAQKMAEAVGQARKDVAGLVPSLPRSRSNTGSK